MNKTTYTREEVVALFIEIRKHYNFMYPSVKLDLLNSFIEIIKKHKRDVTMDDLKRFKLEWEEVVKQKERPRDITMEQLLNDFLQKE